MDPVVLAHGGGAPEAATVVIPLAVVIWFVIRERKNVRALREQEEQQGQEQAAEAAKEQP